MEKFIRLLRKPKLEDVDASGNKIIYGDLTNRLFCTALDLALLYIPLDYLTKVVMKMCFPIANQFQVTQAKVLALRPQFEHDTITIVRFIVENYPEDMVVIIRQVFFVMAFQLIVLALYFVPMTYKYGATLGKMLVGLQVVDNITGKGLTFSQSLIRYIAYIPSAGILGLGFLFATWRRDRRGWHDFIADTVVIYNPDRWYKKRAEKIIAAVRKFFNLGK